MAEQYGVNRDVIRRAKEELTGQDWLIVLGAGHSSPIPSQARAVSGYSTGRPR
jgi:hypothetical protein